LLPGFSIFKLGPGRFYFFKRGDGDYQVPGCHERDPGAKSERFLLCAGVSQSTEEAVEEEVRSVIELCGHFPLNAVLERRGDDFIVRKK